MQPRAIPFLGLTATLLAAPPADAANCPRGTLTGEVTYVRDGDTIVVGSMPIRLNGLAAPEGDEPGGAEATEAMLELVQSRTLRCELDGERTHDRCVGVCYLNGEDTGEAMVRQGLARDCPGSAVGAMGRLSSKLPTVPAVGRTYALPGYCRSR